MIIDVITREYEIRTHISIRNWKILNFFFIKFGILMKRKNKIEQEKREMSTFIEQ